MAVLGSARFYFAIRLTSCQISSTLTVPLLKEAFHSMPTLKQITCNVEWSSSNVPLHEYQTIYADGFVETYVAVPPIPTQFSIHLRSHGYIAPGLAMFVYMDGEYQCNRNRSNLKTPNEARTWRQTEVDFKVRQKEEVMPDGSFSGKQWKFELLKTGKSKKDS